MKDFINCYNAKCPVLIFIIGYVPCSQYVLCKCPVPCCVLVLFLKFSVLLWSIYTAMCLYTIMFTYNATERVTAAAIAKDAYVLLNDLPRHKFHILKRLSRK